MSQIEARPKHLFSWGFDLHTQHGPLATMDMSWLREGGSFEWQGAAYTLGRESWLVGDFLLQSQGKTVARAVKENSFLRKFQVQIGARDLVLKAASPFGRPFILMEDACVIGNISPHHPFTRSSAIELPDDLQVPVQVFLFWLVALMWKRAANNAAGAT